MLAAIVAGLVFADAPQLLAGEPAGSLQVAAASPDQPHVHSRTARPTLPREIEVAQLLAQLEMQPARKEGAIVLDVVLVELAPDLPPGSAQTLGSDHGLEIVDVLDFTSLELRLIRYRLSSGGALADVLPKLRQDARVRSAQTNVVYRTPDPDKRPAPAAPPAATRPSQEAKVPPPRPTRAKGKTTAAKTAARKSAGGIGPAPASPASAPPERRPAPVTQTALRFPTADEPFVNRGGR